MRAKELLLLTFVGLNVENNMTKVSKKGTKMMKKALKTSEKNKQKKHVRESYKNVEKCDIQLEDILLFR